ncbi:nuclear transport factor 2 family protein [Ferrimicrobium sp.]|uniref:YybH family protein n=1 Tax=Ferrimicrobium sp. TaxID=2926050 RepID=UPI0026314CEA|nr:nuclear transport factor 2 family protein [Ferrimicrobium sp.]
MDISTEIAASADHVIEAFSRFDRRAYFDSFDPEATVAIYYSPNVMGIEEYQRLWDDWVNEGFEVLSCESSNRIIQEISNDVGLFVHDVHTEVSQAGEHKVLTERETIVLRKNQSGAWLVIHEHLSHPEL